MKFALIAILALAGCAIAQAPKVGSNLPKPPVGVPTDAQFFKGRWYKVFLEKVPWNRAKERCQSLGGRLATVPDAETWSFVKNITPACVWLGATDEVHESIWKWVDGTDMKFAEWFDKQPDNAGKVENYLIMWKGKMADIPKNGKAGGQECIGFLCEWVKK